MIRLFGVFGPFTTALLLAVFYHYPPKDRQFLWRSQNFSISSFLALIFFLGIAFARFLSLIDPRTLFLISSGIYLSFKLTSHFREQCANWVNRLAATATVTSSAALSLASLSLSTSPPAGHAHTRSLSQSMQTLGHGHSQSLGHGSLPSYSYTQGYPYHGVPIVSGSLHNSGAVPIPSRVPFRHPAMVLNLKA